MDCGTYLKLYTTPSSILTFVTWVPQSRLAFGHSAGRLVVGPLPNLIIQCAASLTTGGYDRPCKPIKSLFLLSPARILDGKAWLYSSKLSYSAVVLNISSCIFLKLQEEIICNGQKLHPDVGEKLSNSDQIWPQILGKSWQVNHLKNQLLGQICITNQMTFHILRHLSTFSSYWFVMLVRHSHSLGYADPCLWESMTGSWMNFAPS